MRRLRSNSRKNRIYKVFREVGRSVRTVALLRYLADPQLRARVTAATNKVESYHGFAQWLGFGNNGVLADNDPADQEKLSPSHWRVRLRAGRALPSRGRVLHRHPPRPATDGGFKQTSHTGPV
jgi:hypothetical protein